MEKLTVERLKQANEIVKKIKLPVQPKIVIDINREASCAEPDFQKISALIGKDVGLTVRVGEFPSAAWTFPIKAPNHGGEC